VKNALTLAALLLLPPAAALAAETKAAEAPKGAKISIDPQSFDFGNALPNKTLSKEFVVKNLGGEDLRIEGVTTTCGCTVAEGYDKVVKPGGTTTLRVKLETRNYSGHVKRSVIVKSNDADAAVVEVSVTAEVQAAEASKPPASKQ